MSNATVLKYQTLFDVSTQETGSIDAAFAIALANGLSVTDVVEPGSTVLIPETLTIDAKTVDYFLARQIKPASDNVSQTFEPLNWGAYWMAQSATSATGKVSAMKGQTLFDIALQETGSAENALSIALLNSLSVTDMIDSGDSVDIPKAITFDNKVVEGFSLKQLKPASEVGMDTYAPLELGPYWFEQGQASITSGVALMKGQSIFDIAIQETGTAENALALLLANGLSLSAAIEVGTFIYIPSGIITEPKVASYLADKGIKPASDADETNTEVPLLEGIGYWAIGVDFIIS